MKKLFHVLTLLLTVNFLALLGGVGWLWKSGHLDKARAVAVKEVLFPKPESPGPAPGPAKAAATQPFVNLDELLARHAGKRAGEQVEVIQQSFDVQSAQLDRKRRELEALAEQVAREQKALADAGAALEESRKRLEQREKQDESEAGDKGFQDSLKLYSSMPPSQVKKVFMNLSEDTIVNYLQAMPPRSATRIIKEFKTKEELDLIHHVLEKMRRGGPPATSTGPASAGGNPQPSGPTTEAKRPGEPKEPSEGL
jgi:flagellar motility protein MotE (MotC chaperone)